MAGVLSTAVLIWLNRLRVMTLKELLQLDRDIALIMFAHYGFTADVHIAGSGFTYELHDAPFAVADSDHSAPSRELIGRFHAPVFDLAAGINKPEQATSLLDHGKVVAALNHILRRSGTSKSSLYYYFDLSVLKRRLISACASASDQRPRAQSISAKA